jgi:hypothetical protein
MPWLLYPRGNRSRYPLDRRLDEPQSRSGRCGEETNLSPVGYQTPAVQPVGIQTELSRLRYVTTKNIKKGADWKGRQRLPTCISDNVNYTPFNIICLFICPGKHFILNMTANFHLVALSSKVEVIILTLKHF